MSATEDESCIFCVEQEATRLVSLCVELGLEPQNREDVLNLIKISGFCSRYRDQAMLENVIDAVLEQLQ